MQIRVKGWPALLTVPSRRGLPCQPSSLQTDAACSPGIAQVVQDGHIKASICYFNDSVRADIASTSSDEDAGHCGC